MSSRLHADDDLKKDDATDNDDHMMSAALASTNAYMNARAQPSKMQQVHDIITAMAEKSIYHKMSATASPGRKAGVDAVSKVRKAGIDDDVMSDKEIKHAVKVAFDDAKKKKKTTHGGGGLRRSRRTARVARSSRRHRATRRRRY